MSEQIERLLLSPLDASKLLGISPRTLWQLTKDGKLRPVRIRRLVRYAMSELRAFIDRQQQTEGNA